MPTSRRRSRAAAWGLPMACVMICISRPAVAAPPVPAASPVLGAGITGLFTGIGILVVISLAVALVWWYITTRSRRSRQVDRYSQAAAKYSAPGTAPSASVADLRARAGSLLVSTDDAIAHAEQEVAFAQAQFGEDQIRPFHIAIDQAKAHMRRSFQLQNQLDDDIPDTEEDQRTWLNEIIAGCTSAQESLKQHEENFSSLRQLERRAPEALDELDADILTARGSIPSWTERYSALKEHYASEATSSVSENLGEAEDRLAFAEHVARQARQALNSGDSSEAVVNIRSGEEAVGQATGLLEAIGHASDELDRADKALSEATAQAKTDLAETSSLMQRGAFSDLAGSTASVESVVQEIEAARQRGPIDPLALSRRLSESRRELDKGLESIRDQNQRDRAARETLAHTMLSAQARLTSAADYVRSRRGGIQSEARTRLREAERHVDEAEKLRVSDPSGALNHANQAIRLAEDAQRIAMGDVSEFSQQGYGPAGGFGSAALGGIFFGQGGARGFPGSSIGQGGPGAGGAPGFGGGFTGRGL
ncbi:TPM domain-containing protein [Curtobacterium sp. S6]|uniref:TPM domain-containing protein n=1 Tax=Curtobacterium sp. S6 TaxID=1479623 RepID=UPI00128F7705|nr:TPM domain-containing protein [Curtobacterium sp. S6]